VSSRTAPKLVRPVRLRCVKATLAMDGTWTAMMMG
jgi:hypothetical protein